MEFNKHKISFLLAFLIVLLATPAQLKAQDCQAEFTWFENDRIAHTLQFIDNSTGDDLNYSWSYGDGKYGTVENPMHTFPGSGYYRVCLTVTDDAGNCNNTHCEWVYVDDTPSLSADFSYMTDTGNNLQVHFFDQSIGEHDQWFWDFGENGGTSVTQNPVETYEFGGVKHVCLTVTNNQSGTEAQICKYINLSFPDTLDADFTYSPTASPFGFNFQGYANGNIILWQWYFGDGIMAYDQNPSHTFPGEGVYPVYFVARDSVLRTGLTMKNVVVTDNFLADAQFRHEIPAGNPLEVTFTDESSGEVASWSWDFGDGNSSGLRNPVHTYSDSGSYMVSLKVMNPTGEYSSVFCDKINTVLPDSCIAGFEYEYVSGNPGTVQFTDISQGPVVQWSWDFGDGFTSGLQSPQHTYSDEGIYPVCLTVSDSSGIFTDIYCEDIVIESVQMCNADFDDEPLPGESFTIQFNDLSEGPVSKWLWDFGDGGLSEEQNPVHVFADTGLYQVTLVVSNEDSMQYCSDSVTQNVMVTVPMPDCSADFIMHPDSGVNRPNMFHFHDVSEYPADAWFWDFGDGNTSTEQNPVHQYAEGGGYDVSLTVSRFNPWGDDCFDTKTVSMETPAYYHIGGFVYTGHFPINNPDPTGDTALVYLYRYHNNENIVSIDTSVVIENGYFHALFLLKDTYMIKFRLTDHSTNAASYFPTYFGDKKRWQAAPVLSLADSSHYHVDVHLAEIPDTESGPGEIEGTVDLHGNTDNPVPADDSEILIFNSSGQAIGYRHSESSGEFSFTGLPYDTYTLYAESTGLFTEPVTITIDETNPAVYGVQIDLYTTEALSVDEPGNDPVNRLQLYPNPVGQLLNVATGILSEQLYYSIFDFSGREIKSGKMNSQNHGNATIDVAKFHQGIYILHVYSADGNFSATQKFVK